MKKLRFDWLMFILSVVMSGGVAILLFVLGDIDQEEIIFDRALYSMVYFALPLFLSVLTVCLVGIYRRRQYDVYQKNHNIICIIIALVSAAILGGGGQYLYALEIGGGKSVSDEVSVAVLTDHSNGMWDYSDEIKQALIEMTDEFESDAQIMLIPFATDVFYDEVVGFVSLDNNNKESIKQAIKNSDHIGDGDFDEAFEYALDSFADKGFKTILLASDGNGEIDSKYAGKIKENNIKLVLLKPNDSKSELDAFVSSVKGDILVLDTDTKDIGKELEKATTTMPAKGGLGIGDGILYSAESVNSIYKFFVRVIIFMVYILLASWAMYGNSLTKESVIASFVTAILAAVLMFIKNDIVAAFVHTFAFWAAFTRYYPIKGGSGSV